MHCWLSNDAYHTLEYRIKILLVFLMEQSLTPNGLLIECVE
jgi:hypothetical protein